MIYLTRIKTCTGFDSFSDSSYTKREIIPMIQRDRGVKKAPQRFQDELDLSFIDVCICFDDRVFDSVLEGLIVARL